MEEEMLKSNLEIQLIDRSGVDERDADFRTFVLGARDPTASAGRYIITGFSEKFGDAMVTLNLENYYVISLIWMLDDTEDVIDEEHFDRSPESQNHAFEMIQEVIKTEGGSLICKEKDGGMSGPKRIEIEIKRTGILYQGASATHGVCQKKQIVVDTYSPPKDAFKQHTVRGREWFPVSKFFGSSSDSFHSDSWAISKIEIYHGNNSSNVAHYNESTQGEAWRRVHDSFDKLSDSEKEAIRKWDPPHQDDDDYDSVYGYGVSNYYHRTPSTYKPSVAEFRVSGDEIGAKIHLEQMERLVGSQDLSAEEVLAEADKKKEADKPEAATTTGVFGRRISSRGGSRGGFDCDYCGLPNCNGCQDVIGGTPSAFPFAGSHRHTTH